MSEFIAKVPQALQNLGLQPVQYSQTFELTAAQVRTLQSAPITLVPSAGANIVLLPVSDIVAFKAATPAVNFSGPVALAIEVGTTSETVALTFDGSANKEWLDLLSSFAGVDFTAASMIGDPIILTAYADVTLGAGTLFVTLSWWQVDLTDEI